MACFQKGGNLGNIFHRSHGQAGRGKVTKTYRAWTNMHKRCSNPAYEHFADYGGRGITVCPEWNKFETFLADMGDAPVGRSLDRRDNEKGYSKDNCRWATRFEQMQNRRNNRNITHNGETHCLSEWARRAGFTLLLVWKRLNRGWTMEQTLSTPLGERRN